jgi:tetratricopeptide (TPR) repeat protein
VKRPSTALPLVLVIGLVVLGVGVMVGSVLLGEYVSSRSGQAQGWELMDEDDDEELVLPPGKQVLRRPGQLDDAELRKEVAPLFEELGAALRDHDGRRAAAQFDAQGMIDEAVRDNTVPNNLQRDPAFLNALRKQIVRAFGSEPRWSPWVASDVRHVKPLGGAGLAVVVRHRLEDGTFLKLRWWLIGTSGAWQVYDLEEVDTGLRASVTLALAAQAGDRGGRFDPAGQARAWQLVSAVAALREAFAALDRQDLNTAERKLNEATLTPLPSRLNVVHLLAEASLQIKRGQRKEALVTLDRAAGLQPDLPALQMLRGLALRQTGQWAESLKHLQAYRAVAGDDPLLCKTMGDSLRGVSRFAEAATLYRKALDLDPKDSEAFLGLMHALAPNEPRDDVPGRFARLDNRRDNFVSIAQACADVPDAAGLEQLALAMRKLDPVFEQTDYFLALARAWQGKGDEAAALFKSALARQPDAQKRRDYLPRFLKAMAYPGRSVAAYRVAPDPDEAFRFLAARLQEKRYTYELKGLIEARAKERPNDPLLPLYRGEVLAWEGNYAQAKKAFAEGLARRPDRLTLEPFRAARVLVRYHSGDRLGAYRDIGPREETFAQLAELLLADRDLQRLQRLIEEHGKHYPRSKELARFIWRLLIYQGKIDQGVARFREFLAGRAQPAERRQTVSTFLSDMLEAGKPIEAYRAAPDASQAFEELASELLDEDRHEELNRLLAAHRARKPGDPLPDWYAGQVHLNEEAWGPAAQALEQAWKKADKEQRRRFRWAYMRSLYKAGQASRALAEVEPRKDTCTQLAYLMTGDGKGAELKQLVAAQRKAGDNDSLLLFHEAQAQRLLKQYDRALSLFESACGKTSKQQQQGHVYSFLRGMAEAGRGLDAYRVAPDAASAFSAVASVLLQKKRTKELLELLELHGRRHPDDPNRLYQAGELYLLRGDLAQAEHYLSAALNKARPQTRWMYRNALHRLRVRAGRTVETYRRPGQATFAELAGACLSSGNAGELAALLAAHRAARPDDADLPGWEIDLLWLKKDHAGVCERLLAQRALLASPRWRWKFEGYLVRCLVRLKKADQAVKEAEGLVKSGHGDRLPLVLARAAKGDVQGAIRAAEKIRHRGGRQRCYQDEDLGPLLRGPAFAPFRERFPEAKEPKVGRR